MYKASMNIFLLKNQNYPTLKGAVKNVPLGNEKGVFGKYFKPKNLFPDAINFNHK